MADITNAATLRFVAECGRPMAERLRALTYKLQADDNAYQTGPGADLYANSAGTVVDGREELTPITGSDVIAVMNAVEAIRAVVEAAGVQTAFAKLCVRPLEAS